MKPNPTILFGAGCFWGVQDTFDALPGVLKTEVGFASGHTQNPSYQEVCRGDTGHAEVVWVSYDPHQISLETLLETFWHCHDPSSLNRQGPDIGAQYRSCIYYTDPEQLESIESSKHLFEKSGKKVVTEIKPFSNFYKAEEYHQHYHKKACQSKR